MDCAGKTQTRGPCLAYDLGTRLQGFDPFSTICFRNTTHLVAIFGSLVTNNIIGSDIWALGPPKLCVALVISSVASGSHYCYGGKGGCEYGFLLPQLVLSGDNVYFVLR